MKKNIITFDIKGDERGWLVALEKNKNVPFDIKRVYYIYGNKDNNRRGFHAHKQLQQLAICTSGSCKIMLEGENDKEEILLDSPNIGLIIDEMVWHEMFDFSADCVLMVLADDYYDENDYIRDYDQFLKRLKTEKGK